MGRKQKYFLPEFESWLISSGKVYQTRRNLVRCICEIMKNASNYPTDMDAIESYIHNEIGTYSGYIRSAWNHYLDFLSWSGKPLGSLRKVSGIRNRGVEKLSLYEDECIAQGWSYVSQAVDASINELHHLSARNLFLYKINDDEVWRLHFDANVTAQRSVYILLWKLDLNADRISTFRNRVLERRAKALELNDPHYPLIAKEEQKEARMSKEDLKEFLRSSGVLVKDFRRDTAEITLDTKMLADVSSEIAIPCPGEKTIHSYLVKGQATAADALRSWKERQD